MRFVVGNAGVGKLGGMGRHAGPKGIVGGGIDADGGIAGGRQREQDDRAAIDTGRAKRVASGELGAGAGDMPGKLRQTLANRSGKSRIEAQKMVAAMVAAMPGKDIGLQIGEHRREAGVAPIDRCHQQFVEP